MLESTLVTSLDATILLETMLISPHTFELGGDLGEEFDKQQTIQTSNFQADERCDGLIFREFIARLKRE